jgi:hypothetical protein
MVDLLFSQSRGFFFIMPVLLLSLRDIACMIGREQRLPEGAPLYISGKI